MNRAMKTDNSSLERLDIEYRETDFIRQTLKELGFTLCVILLCAFGAFALIDKSIKNTVDKEVYSREYTVIGHAETRQSDVGSGLKSLEDYYRNSYLIKVDNIASSKYYIIDTLKSLAVGHTSNIYMMSNDGTQNNLSALITLDDSAEYLSAQNSMFYILYQFISLTIIVLIVNFIAYTYTRYKVKRKIKYYEMIEEQRKNNPNLHVGVWWQ